MINTTLNLKLSKNKLSIFYIKTNNFIKDDQTQKCYKNNKVFSWVYHLYLTIIVPFSIFMLYLYFQAIFLNVYISIFLVILSYLIFEFLLIFLVPLNEVPCIEENIIKNK